MTEVSIPRELLNRIAEEEIIRTHERRAKRELQKQHTAELVAQGIDKDIAKAMTQAYWNCGL